MQEQRRKNMTRRARYMGDIRHHRCCRHWDANLDLAGAYDAAPCCLLAAKANAARAGVETTRPSFFEKYPWKLNS